MSMALWDGAPGFGNAKPDKRVIWTDKRIQHLKTRWADGCSAGLIADELHTTRNAVVGMVFRMKLPKRETTEALDGKRYRRPKKPRIRAQRKAPFRGLGPLSIELPFEPILPETIPVGQRKTLLELTEHTCKWPVGDPCHADFFFCGGEVVKGLSYCAGHCRIAYTPHGLKGVENPRQRYVLMKRARKNALYGAA